MKKLRAALLFLITCFLLLCLSGCGNPHGRVDTVLNLDASFSGSRVMTCSFPLSRYADEAAQAALDDRISACPTAMTYHKQTGPAEITYTFTLSFSSYEDYMEKLASIMGVRPFSVYNRTDSIFTKGLRISEDFDSAALFQWLSSGQGGGPAPLVQCGGTEVVLEGVRRQTSGCITVNLAQGLTVDKIGISTVNHGRTLDRTFTFYLPKATVLALGSDLPSYFNARAQGAEVGWEEFESGSVCTILFQGLTPEELSKATNRVLNAGPGGEAAYLSESPDSTPFSKRSEWGETLDLSAYTGENGRGVRFRYQYQNDSGVAVYASQRFEMGQWRTAGSEENGVTVIEGKGAGMKIRVPGGVDYPVAAAQVALTCEGGDQYTRQIDFLFPKDGEAGLNYAVSQFQKKDPSLTPVRLEDESNLICRLLLSGTAEELSEKLALLFGEGNSFTYQSEGRGVELNRSVSITDTISMGRLFLGENRNTPVTYTVETNGKVNLNSLRYESEARVRNLKIVNGSVYESFPLEGGNGTVVYNGTQPRFWGVVFYFFIALAVIAGAVTLIVVLKRRAARPGKPESGTRDPQSADTPLQPPKEVEETVEDILSRL